MTERDRIITYIIELNIEQNVFMKMWGKNKHLRDNLNKTVEFDHRVSLLFYL